MLIKHIIDYFYVNYLNETMNNAIKTIAITFRGVDGADNSLSARLIPDFFSGVPI